MWPLVEVPVAPLGAAVSLKWESPDSRSWAPETVTLSLETSVELDPSVNVPVPCPEAWPEPGP